MPNFYEQSIEVHKRQHGKIEIASKVPVDTKEELSIAYTPGVAGPCEMIHDNPAAARDLTIKRNAVAVVTDGSAVLGLGNIGPLAAIPVMEGKCLLFKKYANIDAWPLCLDTQDTDEIVETVRRIAPVFGAINLEDIAAPRCFEVEKKLQDLGIPVFHDDQHGTAIVLLAALINACKVTGKKMSTLKIAISGAGAAGIAIAKLLRKVGYENTSGPRVLDVVMADSKGIIHSGRTDLDPLKRSLLSYTNRDNIAGTLFDALVGADVFIGVSKGGILRPEHIRTMNAEPIVFAMANPYPEILPAEAREGGAVIVGTGRSDYPNQVNNVLAFPGIFRGALDAQATSITAAMKIAAVYALVDAVENPTADQILPDPLDFSIGKVVGDAVTDAATL